MPPLLSAPVMVLHKGGHLIDISQSTLIKRIMNEFIMKWLPSSRQKIFCSFYLICDELQRVFDTCVLQGSFGLLNEPMWIWLIANIL